MIVSTATAEACELGRKHNLEFRRTSCALAAWQRFLAFRHRSTEKAHSHECRILLEISGPLEASRRLRAVSRSPLDRAHYHHHSHGSGIRSREVYLRSSQESRALLNGTLKFDRISEISYHCYNARRGVQGGLW